MSKELRTAILTLLVVLIIMSPISSLGVAASTSTAVYASEIQVIIDGNDVVFDEGSSPVIVDGHMLIPVRRVFEQLGHEVYWFDYGIARVVYIDFIKLYIVSEVTAYYDINLIESGYIPAQLINGSTMIPVCAMIECIKRLSHYAVWYAEHSILNISSNAFDDNIAHMMNELADSLREKGLQVVILENHEVVRTQLLFAFPGLPFGIVHFMIDGEVVATVNSELFHGDFDTNLVGEVSDIFDYSRPRTHYVSWTSWRGLHVPIYYIQIFDEEALLLAERFDYS